MSIDCACVQRACAVEAVTLAMQLTILLPIGADWHVYRRKRRLGRILSKWHRWAHGHRRGLAAEAKKLRSVRAASIIVIALCFAPHVTEFVVVAPVITF